MTDPDDARANRRAWLDYLRAPGRRKTKYRLEDPADPEARCCLGHACAALPGLAERSMGALSDHCAIREYGRVEGVYYDDADGGMPDAVCMALGVGPHAAFRRPVEIDGRACESAADLNDYTDLTPAEIADVLEEQFSNGNMVEE